MTGFIFKDGVPVEVAFEISDGQAVLEGDIILGPAGSIARSIDELLAGPYPGSVHSSTSRRWPSGRVPYAFHSGFGSSTTVLNAIADIESRVDGVDFVPKTSSDSDYILFRLETDPGACGSSDVGRKGGAQDVKLITNAPQSCVIHELGHALGFWHEQSRCDRDDYVLVMLDSVLPGRQSQFKKHCAALPWWEADQDGIDLQGYDVTSRMHYHAYAFGDTTGGVIKQTIKNLTGADGLLASSSVFSSTDINTINEMYQPYVVQWALTTNSSGLPLFSWTLRPNAISYSVDFVVEYQYNDDLNNVQEVFDISTDWVGSTSGSSLLDASRTYTGNSNCEYYRDTYSTVFYNYYYEITAEYPAGIGSQKRRFPAPVGASYYPCPAP